MNFLGRSGRLKKGITLGILFSAILLTGCSDVVEKSTESAEKIKNLASEFNSLIEESNVEDTVNEIEGKVSEGVTSAAKYTVAIIKENASANSPVADSGAELVKAKVEKIVDGDTVYILVNGEKEKVRMILVNTPESKGEYEDNPQPFALEAANFTEEILTGATVWIEKGVQERDPYDRLLAYLWLSDVSYDIDGKKRSFQNITFNEILLYEGLAKVAVYPPNTQYIDEFKDTESEAKANKRGQWANI